MTHSATIDSELEFLTAASVGGVSADVLRLATQASERQVGAALGRAEKARRLAQVGPGRYAIRTGMQPLDLSEGDRRRLAEQIRGAIAAKPPAVQGLALAHLLLSLDEELTERTLESVLAAAQAARKEDPDDLRGLLEAALAREDVWLHPAVHAQLALTFIGTLTVADGPRVWRQAFDDCYRAAMESGDITATVESVERRVNQLLELGAEREAEAELRHALSILGEDAEARLHLSTQMARLRAFRGEYDDARLELEEIIQEASERRLPVLDYADGSLNSVLAMQLHPRAQSRLTAQLRRAVKDKDWAEASIAASLGAGLAFMYGDAERARVLARESAVHGTNIGRHWRDAERALIEAGHAFATADFDRFVTEVGEGIDFARKSGHKPVLRALISLRMRWEILRADRAAFEASAADITELAGDLRPVYGAGVTGILAAADMAAGHRPTLIPGLRDAATYWGLGGVLAALEVLATGGSRASALSLRSWGEEAHQNGVLTAPDWPVHLERVLALATLRLGKQAKIAERLRAAADRADAMQHVVEGAIARLQYAEVADALNARTSGEPPTAARERAVERLLEWGFAPQPLALTAAQAALRATAAPAKTDLSKGQAEVLQLLAEGKTYKQAGEQLGISWRTVQTQAKYAYAKLGAHDRQDAIAKARRRGEI